MLSSDRHSRRESRRLLLLLVAALVACVLVLHPRKNDQKNHSHHQQHDHPDQKPYQYYAQIVIYGLVLEVEAVHEKPVHITITHSTPMRCPCLCWLCLLCWRQYVQGCAGLFYINTGVKISASELCCCRGHRHHDGSPE